MDELKEVTADSNMEAALKQAASGVPATQPPAPVSNPAALQDSPPQGNSSHMGTPPNDGAPGSGNEGQPAPAPAAAAPAPSTEQPVKPEDWLKQVSDGKYDSWEKIQADLAKPPVVEKVVEKVVEPFKFPTPESEQVYNAIYEGKYDVLAPFIEQHVFRAQLDTMSHEQIVKASIRKEYPSFDEADVQEEYNRVYVPDELQLNQADYAREQKKAKDRLTRDANKAKAEFLNIKPVLDLPKPQAAQPAAQPAAPVLTEESKQIVSFGSQFTADKVSKIPFGYESQDKTTKVQGEIALPAEQVGAIASKIQPNPEAFLSGFFNRWLQANGEYDVNAIARDVWVLDNPGFIANTTAQASSVQTLEAKLMRDRNYQPPSNRGSARDIMPTATDEDRDKLLAFAGVPSKK